MTKIIIRFTIVLLTAIFLSVGCASLSSPQGGPKDSLPPRVTASFPEPRAVNFNGDKVVLDFNEFIKLKDHQKLFVVSPEQTKKAILTTKGKSVVVTFNDSLDKETTYRLDFGNSITDNNEGNILNDFSFVFSTGPYIDSLMMVGQTLDARTLDTVIGGVVSYYFAENDSSFLEKGLDSTLNNARARAMFRTDSSGYFVADILQERPYRVYAIEDKNGNQKYEPGTDKVGFLDSVYNPALMAPFAFSYDSIKRRVAIDSLQLNFLLFPEKLKKRQSLSEHKRAGRNKLTLIFNSENASYDSLTIKGIPPEWLITDRSRYGDSISLWIAPPTVEDYKALKDTITGSVVYMRQDSVLKYYPQKTELKYINIPPIKKEEKRSKKDTVVIPEKNPFGFKVAASTELNPENGICFTFDYPLRKLDTAAITIEHIVSQESQQGARRGAAKKESQGKAIKQGFTIEKLSMNEILIQTDWKTGDKYNLTIPAGTFENIAFQSNDTLKSSFTILDPDKFGTIVADIDPDTTLNGVYVVELTSLSGKEHQIVAIKKGVKAGDKIPFRFLRPSHYQIRIIKDDDANGEWSSGDLQKRIQPERVALYHNNSGQKDIIAKERWEIVEHVNLKKLFEPKL